MRKEAYDARGVIQLKNMNSEKITPDTEQVKEHVEKRVRGIKKLIQEFKDFAMRGNMIDMAVGIVIGTAFTAMVQSIVNDTFMPLVEYFIGGGAADYEGLKWHTVNYGMTISAIINFIILAAIVFVVVKAMNALSNIAKKEQEKDDDVQVATELAVLEEIRDLLEEQKKA